MKRFAIATLFVSTTLVACGEKAPAPAAPAPVVAATPKATEPKPEEKPAEPAEKPVEAAEAAEKPAEPAEAAEKPAEAAEPVEAAEQADVPAITKNWRLFEPEEGTFSIRAPGQVQTMPQEAETVLGTVTYVNHIFTLPEGMLMVAWADLPLDPKEVTEVEKKMFDGGRDGMMKAINAKLIEETQVELDGFPGRTYLMELEVPGHGTAQNHVRTFLAGNRHYTLQGLGMGTGPKLAQLAFLDSFRITKKADAAPK